MRTRPALLLASFAALAPTGCNWGSFDSVLNQAPVVVFAPPGRSTSSAFVLPLPVPAEAATTSAARMLVASNDSDYLGVADFDLNGKVRLTKATDTERGNLRGAPVLSAAMRTDGLIMLGVPGSGGPPTPGGAAVSLTLVPIPGGGYSFVTQPALQGDGVMSRLGLAVAAGNVTGATTGDFVVVGDNSVEVVGADGKSEVASTACAGVQFGGLTTENYPFRPLAVGNLLDEGDLLAGGNDEIVLGGNGRVTFLQWDGTKTLACLTSYLTMGTSVEFGSSLAVADFNGDGRQDLAVGAPPDRVYVYLGPLARDRLTVTTPSVTITNRLPNTAFGKRIARYPVPGAIAAQLLVADPIAPAGSFTGKVMLFNVTGAASMTDADAVVSLFDSKEDSNSGLFGMSLGALEFNPGLCVPGLPAQIVPWATYKLDVLTFFNYPISTAPGGVAQDPRCFALKP